ncbi:MAG: NADH-quinone oxidoreductase subunit L [Candidatus Micrarchaeia archaeon]
MIAFVVLLPFLVALLLAALLKNNKNIAYISIAASFASIALLPFVSMGSYSIGWFSISALNISLMSSVSGTNMVLLTIVLGLAPFVYIYSLEYFKDRSQLKRYYIELLAFTIAITMFSISGNFITLFIAWEFLSVTSYLLIGFLYAKKSASVAARKVITIIFIGDIALILSIALFWNAYGTFTFSQIIKESGGGAELTAATLLLMLAIFTKSAQFPFHEWLPDAMEGPVPVSAYLHSATMVKAGVFVAIVLFPIFLHAGMLEYFVVFGLLTAIIAVTNAMRETHVKRILAYSTVEELALMLSAIGFGALGAALYFFFAQAIYKALLFFSSGIMIEANESENINAIYGLRKNKLIYFSTLFGVLALAGFIPFDGFFANIGIGGAFQSNLIAYVILSFISIGTSFFIFRWFFATSKDTKNKNINIIYLSEPRDVVLLVAALAVLTVLASAVFFYFGYFGFKLSFSIIEATVETLLICAGLILSYLVYYKQKISAKLGIVDKFLYNSPAVNFLYYTVGNFVYIIGEGIAMFDLYLNDLFDWIGHLANMLGEKIRLVENGDVSFYVLIFIIGAIIIWVLMVFI